MKQPYAQQWQMQEAKAKLSEVIQKAIQEGPQEISVRGKSTAIILSKKESCFFNLS